MMKIKCLTLSVGAAGLLTGCAPIPSYSVDSYAGSLNQCLDIQGTYEKGLGLSAFLPSSFSSLVHARKNEALFSLEEAVNKNGQRGIKKMWLTIRFIDVQRIEVILFNVDGQSVKSIFNMNEKRTLPPGEEEEFICTQQSWQKSFTRFSYSEGGRNKWIMYSEVEKLQDSSLRAKFKNNLLSGAFGLYHSGKFNIDTISYYRKVDLTVDDIRAMNNKAKKAIEQYDQVATTPPPSP